MPSVRKCSERQSIADPISPMAQTMHPCAIRRGNSQKKGCPIEHKVEHRGIKPCVWKMTMRRVDAEASKATPIGCSMPTLGIGTGPSDMRVVWGRSRPHSEHALC